MGCFCDGNFPFYHGNTPAPYADAEFCQISSCCGPMLGSIILLPSFERAIPVCGWVNIILIAFSNAGRRVPSA